MRVVHEHLLSRDHDVAGVPEVLDVEGSILHSEKLHQVDRGKVTSGIVDKHVLATVCNYNAFNNIRVVERLREVVGNLGSFVHYIHYRRSRVLTIVNEFLAKLERLRVLARQREANQPTEIVDVRCRDTKIEGDWPPLITPFLSLDRGVVELSGGTPVDIDRALNAKQKEELLHVLQQRIRPRSETDVFVRSSAVRTSVGTE